MDRSTSDIERIWQFARDAYSDEIAFAHPTRVAAWAQTDDEIAVALLHDVIEDGHASRESVAALLGGDTDPRFHAVKTLTRDKTGETYEQYLQRVIDSGNRLAVAVKMYDYSTISCRIDSVTSVQATPRSTRTRSNKLRSASAQPKTESETRGNIGPGRLPKSRNC